jgi:DNA-binding transcriptional LysR family regulator
MRWRGNVTAAADELGIQPKNLRKRLDTLGMDLAALRRGEGAEEAGTMTPRDPRGPSPVRRPPEAPSASVRATGRKNESGLSRSGASAPILRDVSTTAAAMEENEAPIKGVTVKPKPLRLLPANQERLRDAKLDLGARHRVETDESTILNQFFEEKFEPWLREKLEPAAAGKRKKNGGGGTE